MSRRASRDHRRAYDIVARHTAPAFWLRLRGSASGRRRDAWIRPFFCEGCQRAHGNRIMRVQVGDFLFCTRTYLKLSVEVRCILMRKDG